MQLLRKKQQRRESRKQSHWKENDGGTLVGKFWMPRCKLKQGSNLTQVQVSKLKINERWTTHFENLLNRPRINGRDIIPYTPLMILEVNEEPLSPEETIAAVRQLKN